MAEATTEGKRMVSYDELIRAKNALESDLEVLMSSQQQLVGAQGKFLENIASLFELKNATDGHELMLPLTSTVYVKGQTRETGRVTVDIGTGYYVEMGLDDAVEYYKRKIEFIQTQVGSIGKLGQEKKGQLMYLMQALQQQK